MKDNKRFTERIINEFGEDSVRMLSYPRETLLRLAKLEDKIEDGTLIELPFKLGDKLYSIPYSIPLDNSKIFEHKVKGFRIIAISENEKSNYIETNIGVLFGKNAFSYIETSIGFLFGKNAFLTKAEAEKRLEALKNEKM